MPLSDDSNESVVLGLSEQILMSLAGDVVVRRMKRWVDHVLDASKVVVFRVESERAHGSRHLAARCREGMGGSDPSLKATERRDAVKYIALIHNNPAAWQALSQAERDAFNADADAFLRELAASGELGGGAVVLAHPSNARTVRVRDGVPAITDGPFAEGKEVLAGYYLLDCESIERATEIVTRDPSARLFAVEVRPVMHRGGTDL